MTAPRSELAWPADEQFYTPASGNRVFFGREGGNLGCPPVSPNLVDTFADTLGSGCPAEYFCYLQTLALIPRRWSGRRDACCRQQDG